MVGAGAATGQDAAQQRQSWNKEEEEKKIKKKKHRARVVLNGGNDFAFSCDEKTEKSQKVSLFE